MQLGDTSRRLGLDRVHADAAQFPQRRHQLRAVCRVAQ